MELAAAGIAVESIAPVDTDEAKHGQIETHAETGRIVHLEGLELRNIAPAITALDESENSNGGTATLYDGLA